MLIHVLRLLYCFSNLSKSHSGTSLDVRERVHAIRAELQEEPPPNLIHAARIEHVHILSHRKKHPNTADEPEDRETEIQQE